MQKKITIPLRYLSRSGVETSFGYIKDESLGLVALHAIKHVTEEEMCTPLPSVPEEAGGREITINIENVNNIALKDIIEAYENHVEQMALVKKKPILDNPYAQLRKVIYNNWCNWPMFNPGNYKPEDPILFDADKHRQICSQYNMIRQIMKRSRHTSKGAEAQAKWLDYCETMLQNGGNETSDEFREAAVEFWNKECKTKNPEPGAIVLETAYGEYTNTTLRQKARAVVSRHPQYNEYGDYQTLEGRIAIVKEFDKDRAEREKSKILKFIDKHKII